MRQQFVQCASLIVLKLQYLDYRYRTVAVGVEPFECIPDSIIRLESLRHLIGGVRNSGTQRTDYSGDSRIDRRKHSSLPFFGLRVRLPNNRGVGLIDAAIFVGSDSGLRRHAMHDECVLTQ